MKILVKAHPKAKIEKVERINQPSLGLYRSQDPSKHTDHQNPAEKEEQETPIYKVSVKEAPEHGKANTAIVKLLAKHFDIPYSSVTLITGETSKQKVFNVEGI